MATSMTLISSVTVGSGGTASIDFTSIPSTYTDLYIKWSARQDLSTLAASDFIYINGTQSSYANRRIEGNGASPYSALYSGNFCFASADGQGASTTANTFANAEMYFPNYTSSKYKSFSVDSVMENNATTAWAELDSNIWSNTAAITRLTLSTSATNVTGGAQKYLQYSTAYLYGIKNS